MYEKNELCPNYLYAQYGLEERKKRMPYGGLNRVDLFNQSVNEFTSQLIILSELRKQYTSTSFESKTIIARCLKDLKGGFCGELSALTRNYIKERYPNACVEIASLMYHEFVVIGRQNGSDPNNVDTWDDGTTLICDPWSEEIYPLSEFQNKQKSNAPIPMFSVDPEGIKINPNHYLSGRPQILPSTIHYAQHNDNGVKKSVQALISIKKTDNPRRIYDEAIKQYRVGEKEKAIQLFNQALKGYQKKSSSFKEQALCYSGLASCHRDKGNCNKALEDCIEAKLLFIESGLTEKSPELSKLLMKLNDIESQVMQNEERVKIMG